MVFSPGDEGDKKTAIYDLVYEKEVMGVSEYGYGLWTRWLMTTPSRLL